jgi:protein-S-isoprenylcysteine O-methyltransferase Ste14
MYAVFLWAAVGSACATLNWVIAALFCAMFWMTARRVASEERILVHLFGSEYRAYRRRVSAFGPPWMCLSRRLGFDGAEVSSDELQ